MSAPLSAAVMDRLARCGMDSESVSQWWRTPHPGLDGTRPVDLISSEGRRVLAQAEADAANITEVRPELHAVKGDEGSGAG